MTKPSPEAIRAWAVSSTRASMALSREEPDMSISEEFGTNLGYEKDRADKAEADLDRAYERYDQAEQDRNHWHDKAQEYRQQSVEYRESRDKWREVAVRDQLSSRDTLPRVITADGVERGMTLAAESMVHSGRWYVGVAGPVGVVDKKSRTLQIHFSKAATIVLLAHAPDAKDINVAKETVKGEYPDNPWFATVYEDATYLADTWRGTPVTPQSIRAGDLYDIHTAHGSRITGVVAARNGVRNPQNGDMYRLISRAGGKA